ncbi:type II toxin-antitoxin system PemK/MazF family toxin [Stenotrophomonas bentonitica]|uniref:type II toxin-antitoxin system PemK/MazF family toxin n=1 Tax=Stenotrophomonas bentonitica TaxID=1450134 RepID=UPI00345E5D32
MALLFHPKPGEIFMCKFPEEYLHGEMIKTRPVIVLNKKLQGRPKLVNVVPISMTPPGEVLSHHVPISAAYLPKGLRDRTGQRWAKCDMVYTMSIDRLDFVKAHKGSGAKRVTDAGTLPPARLLQVRLAAALCLGVHHGSFVAVSDTITPCRDTSLPSTSAAEEAA